MQGSYAECVRDVVVNRHVALRWAKFRSDHLAGGRVLVYAPDEELADGAAYAETGGYLDGNNCPPWDTWIALTQFTDGAKGRAAHLFSWVPPIFESIVERGIRVNPEKCIQWLEDWPSPGDSTLIGMLRSVAHTPRPSVR